MKLKLTNIRAHLLLAPMGIAGWVNFSPAVCSPNPANMYCQKLGYSVSIEKDAQGNEHGVSLLPDGSKVDAWEFYRGKVGQKYSYCAKKGYSIINERTVNGSGIQECAVCVKKDLSGGEERIAVRDLMEKNDDGFLTKVTDLKTINANTGQASRSTSALGKTAASLPTSFDLRNYNGHNFINPIEDQYSSTKCWAYAYDACADGSYNWATQSYDTKKRNFSVQQLICYGPFNVPDILVGKGDVDDEDYTGTCDVLVRGVRWGGHYDWNIPRGGVPTIDQIKQALMTCGPVHTQINSSSSFFGNYSGGVQDYPADQNPCNSDHEIAIVGWGNNGTKEYWIIRNSWGTFWGDQGYMYLTTSSFSCMYTHCYTDYYDPSFLSIRNNNAINQGTPHFLWTIPSGSNIEIVSGQEVRLSPGFAANQGSEFRAYIQASPLGKTIASKPSEQKNDRKTLEPSSVAFASPDKNSLRIIPQKANCIKYEIPVTRTSYVTISVVDFQGKLILREFLGEREAGRISGICTLSGCRSGMYMICATIGSSVLSKNICFTHR